MGDRAASRSGNRDLQLYNEWIRRKTTNAHTVKHKLRVGNIRVFTSVMSQYAKRMTDAQWDTFLSDLSDVLTLHMNEPETDHEQSETTPRIGMRTTQDTND